MEHSKDARGFRFKSVWERLLPFRKYECLNCTRVAETGGRLCDACKINARNDPSIGKYPTVTAVLLVSAAATLIAIPFALFGGDEPTPTAAAPVADVQFDAAPAPETTSETVFTTEPEYSARDDSSAADDYVSETAASEAAFITTLNVNDVPYTNKANAVRLGRSICAVVRDEILDGHSRDAGMDQAQDIMVEQGYATEDAAVYVGAAVGALC